MMKWMPALAASFMLGGCAAVTEVKETVSDTVTDLLSVFMSDHTAYVRESGRSLNCGSSEKEMSVRLFQDANEVRQWETSRNLKLLKAGSGSSYAYALVDMGQQPSGGYGVVVSRKAELDDEVLSLKATLIQPEPDQNVTLEPTDPCVLIVLPQGKYTELAVLNQNGVTVATTRVK